MFSGAIELLIVELLSDFLLCIVFANENAKFVFPFEMITILQRQIFDNFKGLTLRTSIMINLVIILTAQPVYDFDLILQSLYRFNSERKGHFF